MNSTTRARRAPGGRLKGKSICIVEDDSSETVHALEHVGARIVGPYTTEEAALKVITSGQLIDCAIVDIRLSHGISFGVASQLQQQCTPFLFLTAVNRAFIPPQFSRIHLFNKPVDLGLIILATASFFPPKRRPS